MNQQAPGNKPALKSYTAEQKLEAVRRELGYRRRVYARQVEQGTLKPAQAEHQIALFEAIEADYAKAAEGERLL